MSDPKSEISIDAIADSFAARLANGGRPSIEEYKQRYPEFSDEIDEVLPALVILENIDFNHDKNRSFYSDSIPRELGEFRIVSEIGRGGMGIVFEAEHVTMRRRVALKVLPKSSAEKSSHLSRFFTEARSAGQLHHTNIVPIFEFGESEGVHYYAMQYIHGDNLDRVIEEVKQLRRTKATSAFPDDGDPGSIEKSGLDAPSTTSVASQLMGHSVGTPNLAPTFDTEMAGLSGIDGERTAKGNREASFAEGTTLSAENVGAGSLHASTLGGDASEQSDSFFKHGQAPSIGRSTDAYHKRVAAIGVQVGEALEHAHNRGVLHRDIKPANLILDTNGNVWVTDFGLAKFRSDSLTQTGDVIGTLRYMAPERFQGNADRCSDIYSLGLTLYELCTLENAFDGHRGAEVKGTGTSEIVSPRTLDDSIPRDLETIILTAIQSEPSRRYQTAGELVGDLKLFLQDLPITARRTSLWERGWRVCRRNPVLTSLVACVMVLVATVAVVVVASLLQFAELTAERADSERDLKEAAQASLYYSKISQARAYRFSGRLGQRFQSLQAIGDASSLLPSLNLDRIDEEVEDMRFELRNEAIASLSLPDLEKVWERSARQGNKTLYRLAVDRSGNRTAEGFEDGHIEIESVDGTAKFVIPAVVGQPCWQIEFSPSEKYLAATHHAPGAGVKDMRLLVWDLNDITQPVFSKLGVDAFSFSGGSDSIAYSDGRAVSIFSLLQLEKLCELEPKFYSSPETDKASVKELRFNDDGTAIALFQRRSKWIEFWDIESEPVFARRLHIDEQVHAIAWDSSQELFVAGSHRGGLYYWSDQNQTEPKFIQLHQNSITNLHIHSDQKLVATTAWDDTSRITDLFSGKELLVADGLKLTYSGFCEDGRIGFVDADQSFGLWELARPLVETYSDSSGYGWHVAYHSKHPRILAWASDSSITFWDTKRKRLALKIPIDKARDLRFTKDGQSLYTSGQDGLQRWRVHLELTKDDFCQLTVQAPVQIVEPPTNYFDMTADEKIIVVGVGSKLRSVRASDGKLLTQFGGHARLQQVHLSAGDLYALTGTYRGRGIKVWSMATGGLIETVHANAVGISPAPHPADGSVYWTTGDGIRKNSLAENGTLLGSQKMAGEIFESASNAVFSPSGQLLCFRQNTNKLVLVEPSSGKPIAAIKARDRGRILWHRFSPDEQSIAVACFENLQTVSLLDLRRELSKLGLDWPDVIKHLGF